MALTGDVEQMLWSLECCTSLQRILLHMCNTACQLISWDNLTWSLEQDGELCRLSCSARLGWQSSNSCYTPLHCVYPDGGAIPYTQLVVQRKYPAMIWEKLPSGVTRTHTPKAYQAAQSHYDIQAAKV